MRQSRAGQPAFRGVESRAGASGDAGQLRQRNDRHQGRRVDGRALTSCAHRGRGPRAAARLHIAQPALSRQIRALEDELKTALFVRDRRTTVLTAAGEQLLADARDLLAAAEAVHRRVTAAAEAKPVLTVGFMPGIVVTPAVRVLARRRPDVSVRLLRTSWHDQVEVVHDGRVDLSIVRLPVDQRGLTVRPLFTEPRVVMVPAGHRLAGKESVSVTELADSCEREPCGIARGEDGDAVLAQLVMERGRSPAVLNTAACPATPTASSVAWWPQPASTSRPSPTGSTEASASCGPGSRHRTAWSSRTVRWAPRWQRSPTRAWTRRRWEAPGVPWQRRLGRPLGGRLRFTTTIDLATPAACARGAMRRGVRCRRRSRRRRPGRGPRPAHRPFRTSTARGHHSGDALILASG
ncbi:LysR substrate-binding domain-containing protein [Amycolatopsis sp. A133]|uniref:LysR family transcriptional regulator n=1 Tax=Amycolatopsis sp. A133 TaxID=3064472 RepID=UPI0027ED54DA|nr:LysR substrate-binding domain-containing protein [Amycolatopsis sp. A133]MDQ7809780.1 LysR substrate-binding domain-containing protein [Amycolatopsis sp. A133]